MYQNSEVVEYTDEVISRLPHMYNRDKESNNYFLLYIYLKEIKQANIGLYQLLKSLNIAYATGYTLDNFGNTWNLDRDINEDDDTYRIRILTELISQSNNATFDTIYSVLKMIFSVNDTGTVTSQEEYGEYIFFYEEGIRPYKNGEKITPNNYNVYAGYYGTTTVKLQEFERKGGTIYIVINKQIPKRTKATIKNTLLAVRAKGIELNVEFKYKIDNKFYDNTNQTKTYETNLAQVNVITKEGVK